MDKSGDTFSFAAMALSMLVMIVLLADQMLTYAA